MNPNGQEFSFENHANSGPEIIVNQPVVNVDNLFQDLQKIIRNDINSIKHKRDDSDDSNDDFLKGLNQSNSTSKKNGNNFQARSQKLKQALNQYYQYLWNYIQKTIQLYFDGDETQSPLVLIDDFTENIMNPIIDLKNLLNQLLSELILTKSATLNDTLYLNISVFLDDLMIQFCDNIFNIYQNSLNFNMNQLHKSIVESLFNGIYNFSEVTEKTHFVLLTISGQIEPSEYIEEHNESKESDENLEEKYKRVETFYNEEINSHYRHFQEAINHIHAIHEKLFDHIYEIFRKYKPSDQSFSLFEAGILYPRCEGFTRICNVANFTPTSSLFEEDDAKIPANELNYEKIWQKLREKQYNRFVMTDLQFSGNTLQQNLFTLWEIAHKHNFFNDGISIGSMLYNVFDNRSEIRDDTLRLSDVSESYYLTVIYSSDLKKVERNNDDHEEDEYDGNEDEELTSLQLDFGSLLEDLVNTATSNIQSLRSKQYQLLSLPPTEDSSMKEYSRKAKEITQLIQEKATDLNTALYHGREVSFILYQQKEMYKSHESGDEEEEDYLQLIDNLRIYDHEESEMIIRQLNKLTSLHNDIFNKNNTKNYDRSRLLGVADKTKPKMSKKTEVSKRPSRYSKNTFQPTTLYSSKKEKTPIVSQTTKIMISTQMPDLDKIQINLVDDAIVAAYIQLFSSIKGTLVANIRSGDYKQALNVREEITERMAEVKTYINLIKNRSKALNDIQTIKAIEKRIETLNQMQTDDLKKCIGDSLKDVIKANMASYDYQINEETKKYKNTLGENRQKYRETFMDLIHNKHLPDLELIEKKKIITVRKEKQREFSRKEFDQQQIRIAQCMDSNQFKEAKKERAKLLEMQRKTRAESVSTVRKKFSKLEKEKIEEQRQELIRCNERYIAKKTKARSALDQQKEKWLRLFFSSIKSSSQRHYEFALQVLSDDTKTRKEITRLLNNIVYQSLIERYQPETYEGEDTSSSNQTLVNLAQFCKFGIQRENWVKPV